ncbi:glycoside hydrolase family 25 protein [Jiella sp. MQZ9-1]|uniref:Glycoside hydrolase family 25 protein n=2 Tax=Jiella flava TaxID=2816857 RepID=A0A939JY87_9HYPH|nr:glycoside hydrolase family 25 protein [Jiella flava]MCD2472733.1 glycoside hydrolase family 25 protein [Jiella flava]
MSLALFLVSGLFLAGVSPAAAAWNEPWKSKDKALVIDAYEFNPIDWNELTSDKRIAGFINKASDGLPPEWNCSKYKDEDYKLCQNRWWKYSVTKELYQTRRQMAKMKGLLWGAYHLGRPGNPRAQADHFVDFTEPGPNDLLALDIEDNTDDWMSLSDAEIFADQVKIRTGRYPVLYTNGSTAKYIAEHKADYPLLSRLQLWYARYREDITDKFPTETWPSYALWQFSSMHNCNKRSCPYRVKGAKADIDVNVSTYDIAGLRNAWPFDKLIKAPADNDASAMIASVSQKTKDAVASAGDLSGKSANEAGATSGSLLAAYGPSDSQPMLDPLEMLTSIAKGGQPSAPAPAQTKGTQQSGPQVAETQEASPSVLSSEAATSLVNHVHAIGRAVSATARSLDSLVIQPANAAIRLPLQSAIMPLRGETGIGEPRAEIERSHVMKVIAAAQAEQRANALPMPARVLSQLGPDRSPRGGRVLQPKRDEFASLDPADRRIFLAFDSTP